MKEEPAKTHEGTVVSVIGNHFASTCCEGKKHQYTLAKDARVTCEGKACKLADLKAGTQVRVTTHKDDKTVAVAVESGGQTPAAVTSSSCGADHLI